MQETSKPVVVGATGNVRSRTVDEALDAGHEVVAYVRRPDAVAKVPGLPTLPFSNVAKALVSIAESPDLAGERVLITTPKGWRAA